MNGITTFEPAIPAMVVGRSFDGSPPPLGLGEPFALLGGDRLGPDGIPFRILHDHQPGFRRWVSGLPGIAGGRASVVPRQAAPAGRTERRRADPRRALARSHGGCTHVVLNLTDPVIATNIAASRRFNEALWALPITVAMAAARCANPTVTVIGADQVSDDVKAGLAAMIDPRLARRGARINSESTSIWARSPGSCSATEPKPYRPPCARPRR